jgi:hypothetical protein
MNARAHDVHLETADQRRRVEIMLDAEVYERVRMKAMKQRKSLRAVGGELFAAWVDDHSNRRAVLNTARQNCRHERRRKHADPLAI